MMLPVLTLTGAYGREYTTPEGLMLHWNGGKDFRIEGGPYCSVRDLPLMKQQGVKELRFYSRKAHLITVHL